MEKLEKENAFLRNKCDKPDAYKRRWNLRIAGMEERMDENMKQRVISLLSELSPDIADQRPSSVDRRSTGWIDVWRIGFLPGA